MKKKPILIAAFLISLLSTTVAFARAGGAGGESIVGGDDGGSLDVILDILWYVLVFIPFPWNIAAGAILAIALYVMGKRMKSKSNKD